MNQVMIRSFAVAAGCAMIVGCAASTEEPRDTSEQPDLTAEGAKGLEVDADSATSTEGRYARGGATVAFRVTSEKGARTIVIRSTDGAPLLESTSDGVKETDRVFGGRLTISGPIGSPEPTFEGDRAAFDELAARPEAEAVRHLKEALDAAKVRATRVETKPATPITTGTKPQMFNSGAYWYFNGGEERSFPTWTFWYPTNVEMTLHASYNYPGLLRGCVWLRAGAPAGEALCATWGQLSTVSRYYWGVWVNVKNIERYGDWVRVRVF